MDKLFKKNIYKITGFDTAAVKQVTEADNTIYHDTRIYKVNFIKCKKFLEASEPVRLGVKTTSLRHDKNRLFIIP